jgi:hypothetical protein
MVAVPYPRVTCPGRIVLTVTVDVPGQRGMAQFGSASALGAEGPRFKSGYPDRVVRLKVRFSLVENRRLAP